MSRSARIARAVATNARLFCAPGRANIIGEHTDYNDGLVLPTNTALYTWLTLSPRDDRVVSVRTENFAESQSFVLDDIQRSDEPAWIDYIQGVCAEIEAVGIRLHGANIEIQGNIPLGGGLSSSASLELATATAMLAIAGEKKSGRTMAEICQRAERNFVGVQCGIMDQFSVACCPYGQAVLLDCRSLSHKSVIIPSEIRFLLTDSGVKHQHAESGYNTRAGECREAASIMHREDKNIASLRDVTQNSLDRFKNQLGAILHRRSRHVVTEIQRTKDAFDVLGSRDVLELGDLVRASHASLRDDFEISCDEIETLVDIANKTDGVLGSRMVGGGFGGCVLSVVRAEKAQGAMREISTKYAAVTGTDPWIHIVSPTEPAEEVRDL